MNENTNIIKCWCDGACGPSNPGGHMGYGAIVQFEGKCVFNYDGNYQGEFNSNNVAEYLGLLMVIDILKETKDKNIIIYSDSTLVVNQMNYKWDIKYGNYKETALKAYRMISILRKYNNVQIKWIPREQNTDADELSNEGIKKICPEYTGFKMYYKRKLKEPRKPRKRIYKK